MNLHKGFELPLPSVMASSLIYASDSHLVLVTHHNATII